MFVKSRSQFVTFVTIIAAQFPVFRSKPELLLQKGLVRNFANLEISISLTFYLDQAIEISMRCDWSFLTWFELKANKQNKGKTGPSQYCSVNVLG